MYIPVMNNQQSSAIKFFVLADSHAKYVPSRLSTPSYSLITRSISGLKWVDNYDPKLSVYALLSLPEVQSSLIQASAVLFLVGTNSVRILPARQIISQVQQLIFYVQKTYPHLNQPEKISVSLTFPCYKLTRRFPTVQSLISNINQYNDELIALSSQMNFKILNFYIKKSHLRFDNMHIQDCLVDYITDSIFDHFDQVIKTIPTSSSITTTTDPNPPSRLSSTLGQGETTKKSKSRAVLDRKNKKRFEQLKLKRQQHTIKRKIHHQWTSALIKEYLELLQVKYSRIPPVYNRILRIVFNSQHDQDLGDKQLELDIFDEKHYQEFISKKN
jgi:hypothetical protein